MNRLREAAGRALWLSALLGGVALVGVASPAAVGAQTQWDVLVHGSALSYLDSQVKDAGYTFGVYGTLGAAWKHLVEVGGTRTRIEYLSGWVLEQNDLTGAYSRFWSGGSARAGLHFISSADPLTDGSLVLFGGGSAYKVGVWSAGAEAALSSYPDHNEGLTVAQVAPSVGLTATLPSGPTYLSGVLRGYSIHLSEEVGLGERSFLSGEASVSVTSGRLTLTGYAWGGEQAFAVRQGGFLVFNLAELHTGGCGAGLRWVLTPRAALSGGVYVERFEDMEVGGAARARTLAASLGFTF